MISFSLVAYRKRKDDGSGDEYRLVVRTSEFTASLRHCDGRRCANGREKKDSSILCLQRLSVLEWLLIFGTNESQLKACLRTRRIGQTSESEVARKMCWIR
jgi:hypothetical protein